MRDWPSGTVIQHPEEYQWTPGTEFKFEEERARVIARNNHRKQDLENVRVKLLAEMDLRLRQANPVNTYARTP